MSIAAGGARFSALAGRPLVYITILIALGISLLPVAFVPQDVPRTRFFRETGFRVEGRFLDAWESAGSYQDSIARNGFPISAVHPEVNPVDGQTYQVQWFKRARYEAHPEKAPPDYVQFGLLGVDATQARLGEPPFLKISPVPFPSTADRWYVPETQHAIQGPFLAYWQAHGSWKQFGFPISEEFTEAVPGDPQPRRVQYFQRARFEYHPGESPQTGGIILGLLGVELYLHH
jgi:hypothetical protein